MRIVEFTAGTLRFIDELPETAPAGGFVWVFLERDELQAQLASVQRAAQRLGGSTLLDLHYADLINAAHPSHYDYTSIYDLIVFRRLATPDEASDESPPPRTVDRAERPPPAFRRIQTKAVGFAVFDRLLVSVHPAGCLTARSFIQRYLADAVHSEGLPATPRSRLPASPSDLMLRMVNVMVDSYLELRKQLTLQLDHWQQALLAPHGRFGNWNALMAARKELHILEDLCEEQHDAMQEWLDTLLELPAGALPQAERDALAVRARDVIEHIQRVVHHVRRLEQNAETVVQIHFSAQSHRTNDIMRALTALTAVFLPLNLIAGIFGMNFEFIPLVHTRSGFWWAVAAMVLIAVLLIVYFWRKRYLLSRDGR